MSYSGFLFSGSHPLEYYPLAESHFPFPCVCCRSTIMIFLCNYLNRLDNQKALPKPVFIEIIMFFYYTG